MGADFQFSDCSLCFSSCITPPRLSSVQGPPVQMMMMTGETGGGGQAVSLQRPEPPIVTLAAHQQMPESGMLTFSPLPSRRPQGTGTT